MKKLNKAINLTKRLILFFIGMSIIQLGVALFLKTNIGSDPFTVFTQGLATILNRTSLKELSIVQLIAGKTEVTPGVANMIILIVLFTIIILVDRKKIKIGTLICVVGVGPIIDFGVRIVSYFPVESYNYLIRALLVLLGCLIIAVGFSIMSESDLGVKPHFSFICTILVSTVPSLSSIFSDLSISISFIFFIYLSSCFTILKPLCNTFRGFNTFNFSAITSI